MMVGWRLLAVVFGLAVLAAGCSSDSDGAEESSRDLDAPTTEAEEPSTTTSTTIATSTTLSERAMAEAEIEEVITAWWGTVYDGGSQHLTGLIALRFAENEERRAEDGKVNQHAGGAIVEVTSIDVDLDKGEATASSCGGSDGVVVDIDTGERLSEADDPNYQTTSEWVMELTPEGWKIANWFPSFNTGTPVECTIGAGQ